MIGSKMPNEGVPYDEKPPLIKLCKPSELGFEISKKAIAIINNSVNWNGYTSVISRKYLNDDSMRFAVKNDEVVGYVTYRAYTEGKDHENPHLYIPFIAVDPKNQGSAGGNIGIKMMEEIIGIAEEKNAAKVVLEFRGNNEKTKKFYEKVGTLANLKIKNKEKGSYGDGDRKHKFTFYLPKSIDK